VLQGIIRGLGHQNVGAIGNFVAYYIIGLPLGYVLCFKTWPGGIMGLFFGSATGLTVANLFYSWHLRRADWSAAVVAVAVHT
jgi:MATE family multidrug resistance protein